MKMFKAGFLVFSIVMTSIMMTGCHTMKGAGTDIKKGGAALERTADANTNY